MTNSKSHPKMSKLNLNIPIYSAVQLDLGVFSGLRSFSATACDSRTLGETSEQGSPIPSLCIFECQTIEHAQIYIRHVRDSVIHDVSGLSGQNFTGQQEPESTFGRRRAGCVFYFFYCNVTYKSFRLLSPANIPVGNVVRLLYLRYLKSN